ncbi:MAG: PEP-CTERM sorting domain-containing protein [Phycisphaeraceae bacterium]
MIFQLTSKAVMAGVAALPLLAGAGTADAATVSLDSSATSSIFDEASGTNDVETMSYTNNSDFLTVTVHAGSTDKDIDNSASAPTVTYNGVTMNLVHANVGNTNRNTAVYSLANPATGANDLTVDWGTELFSADGKDALKEDGQWMFSAQSLSNVNHANPFAAITTLGNAGKDADDGTWSTVIESDFAGALSAGDLFTLMETLDGGNPVPDYHTPDSTVTGQYTEAIGGLRQAAGMTASLLASDISNGDELVVTQGVVGNNTMADGNPARKTGDRIAVVYNAVPEPASLSLLAAGGLLMLSRRRR